MSYRIKHGKSVPDEVRRICHEEIDDTLERLEESRVEDGDFADAVHCARKNLKKLRALLRLVQEVIGDEVRDRENAAFRDAARLLAPVRDAEVLVKTLANVRKRQREEAPSEAWKQARELLIRERDERLAELRTSDAPFEAGRMLYEARLRIADWPLEGLDWKGLLGGAERIYRQGRERLEHACAELSAEAEHDWRKRVKDLWYHLRLLQSVWPDVIDHLAGDFEALGEKLGLSHDLHVLQTQLAARVGDALAPEHAAALIAILARRRPRFQRAGLAIGERLYAEKPRAFARRLARYRRTWHEELR